MQLDDELEPTGGAQRSTAGSTMNIDDTAANDRPSYPPDVSPLDRARLVQFLALELFGFRSLRYGQLEIILSFLSGRDVFANMPTGGGKTACFALAALSVKGMLLVVSPTTALMDTQCKLFHAAHIPAVAVRVDMPVKQQRDAWHRLRPGQIKICLVSAEKLVRDSEWKKLLIALHNDGLLVGLAVDEAHLVLDSARAAYQQMQCFRQWLPDLPIMALTATADAEEERKICHSLGMSDVEFVRSNAYRPNIHYAVQSRSQGVADQISSWAESKLGVGWKSRCGIVYCLDAAHVGKMDEALSHVGLIRWKYHDEMSQETRAQKLAAFMASSAGVMITTPELGIGIDKPDIRYSVHVVLPESYSRYWQQSGRIGRDSLPAFSLILYSLADKMTLYQHLATHRAGQGATGDAVVSPDQQHAIHNMALYCMTAVRCRACMLLEAMGSDKATHLLDTPCCDHCDRLCGDLDDMNVTALLAAVRGVVDTAVSRNATLKRDDVSRILRGTHGGATTNAKTLEQSWGNHHEYGVALAAGLTPDETMRVIHLALLRGLVREQVYSFKRPTVKGKRAYKMAAGSTGLPLLEDAVVTTGKMTTIAYQYRDALPALPDAKHAAEEPGLEAAPGSSPASSYADLMTEKILRRLEECKPVNIQPQALVQGSSEWLQFRRFRISGTMAKGWNKPDISRWQVSTVYQPSPPPLTAAMAYGRDHEEQLLQYAEKEYNITLQRGQVVVHRDYPYLMASLDGCSRAAGIVVEAKCWVPRPDPTTPGATIPKELPADMPRKFIDQVRHQLLCLPAEFSKAVLVLFNGSEYKHWEVVRDVGWETSALKHYKDAYQRWLAWWWNNDHDAGKVAVAAYVNM